MEKPIEILISKEAQEYLNDLDEKIKDKFSMVFDKTKVGIKGEWFTKLKNSDGIFEFRTRDHQKFYRLLCFWDNTDNNLSLVVATHGFDKKTNKTPKQQIDKAEKFKKDYFQAKIK